MRLKIKLAFLILGLVLSLAGVTSYLELTHLTEAVQRVIDDGAKSVSLSKGVLDVVQKHNLDVIRLSEEKEFKGVVLSKHERDLMDSLYQQARYAYSYSEELEAVAAAQEQYVDVINRLSSPGVAKDDFLTDYLAAYSNFSSRIKDFMISSQQYVVRQTGKLRDNIYRSTMQSVVALSVSVIMLIVFFLMLDIFFIKPVVIMARALDKHIQSGSAFNPKFEGNDEPKQLRESILQIITQLKNR